MKHLRMACIIVMALLLMSGFLAYADVTQSDLSDDEKMLAIEAFQFLVSKTIHDKPYQVHDVYSSLDSDDIIAYVFDITETWPAFDERVSWCAYIYDDEWCFQTTAVLGEETGEAFCLAKCGARYVVIELKHWDSDTTAWLSEQLK